MHTLLTITKILYRVLEGVRSILNTYELIIATSQKFDETGMIFTIGWEYFIQPSISILYLVVIIHIISCYPMAWFSLSLSEITLIYSGFENGRRI